MTKMITAMISSILGKVSSNIQNIWIPNILFIPCQSKYSDLEYFAFMQKNQQMMLQNIKDFFHINDGFGSVFVPDCIDIYCGL